MSSDHAAQWTPAGRAELQSTLMQYLTTGRQAEIVFRDEAGQIQTVHGTVTNLFSRAGQDFVAMGGGKMIRLDQLITFDGLQASRC